MDQNFFKHATLQELFQELDASPQGLTSASATKRLLRFGTNEISQSKKLRPLMQFLAGFKNPLVIILIFAASISGITGEIRSSIIIISMILLSTLMNFVQEYRSMKAADKISNTLQLTVTALRDRKKTEIITKKIVPGDLVYLEAGSIVCADGRLLEASDFFVNESALTGESFPVEKSATSDPHQATVLAGTTVVSGFATMLVVNTGAKTEFGNIAKSLNSSNNVNAFEIGIKNFGMIIVKAVIFIVLIVFFINALLHRDLIESFLFSLAIAVGITPELLPVILSINMAKASVNMAKRGVIVKRLDCIPDFGSMNILCTDKTGTLTQDKITLLKYTDVCGGDDASVLQLAYINGYFETGIKSLLDKAILAFRHLDISGISKVDEIPYDFMRRRSSIVYRDQDQLMMVTKGAPEEIFKICSHYFLDRRLVMTPARLNQFNQYYNELSRQGLRVLAIATKHLSQSQTYRESDMTLHGFVAFYDPPKDDIKATLDFIKNHGIEIKILTGDSALVTAKICKDLGIKIKSIVTGDELDINKLSDAALAAKVSHATICARLSPSQKERIISALRKRGHVVGYLGDGINDAPALKAADVGISVDNAVDVAKETADIILMKKGLAEIMEGVIEGRRTFGNAMKYMLMSLSSNFGNMFSMIGAALFLPFLPMTAGQILLNNFIYDLSQLSIPTDNMDPEYLHKPKQWNIKFITKYMLVFGSISSVFDFMTFLLLYKILDLQNGAFQAGWFFESLATQTLVIYIIRTRKIPFLQSRPSRALALTTLSAFLVSLILVTTNLGSLVGFQKLSFAPLIFIIGLIISYLILVEFIKQIFYRRYSKENNA